MEETEKMKLYFISGSPCSDTEERKRVENMAQKVAVKVNEQVKELMKKFSDILNEYPEDEELGKWIGIQTLVPLSSLIIRTFTTITVNKPTYDLYMEKVWAAIEESRETSTENDRQVNYNYGRKCAKVLSLGERERPSAIRRKELVR